MKTYSLEDLITIFNKHSILGEQQAQDILESFKKNNPGSAIPEWMKNDFSLPDAILCILKEILSLKKTEP